MLHNLSRPSCPIAILGLEMLYIIQNMSRSVIENHEAYNAELEAGDPKGNPLVGRFVCWCLGMFVRLVHMKQSVWQAVADGGGRD